MRMPFNAPTDAEPFLELSVYRRY